MKKVLSVLLLVAMLLSAVCVASASAKTIETTGKVYLRADASTSAKSLTTISKGTELTVLASKGDKRGIAWYKVSYKGKTGYISSMYTTDAATKEKGDEHSKTAHTNTAKKSYTIYNEKLKKIGTLKKGAEYTDLTITITNEYTVKEKEGHGKHKTVVEYKVTETYLKIWYGNQKVGYILVNTEKVPANESEEEQEQQAAEPEVPTAELAAETVEEIVEEIVEENAAETVEEIVEEVEQQ